MQGQRYREGAIDPIRELAMQILGRVHEEGAYANVALMQALRGAHLTERDRRFLTELVYGSVKAGDTLDYMIQQYLRGDMKYVQPQVREILRLGIYQIFFMDRVPASAACNTAVELAKKYGRKGAAAFVNGVLRAAVRTPARARVPRGRSARLLALREQHPQWMVAHWIDIYGYEAAEELCRCNNTEAPLTVRTNTLRISRDELLRQFDREGAEAVPSVWAPEGIRLITHGPLDALAPLRMGLCQVQDESSMLVAHILDPKPHMTVIDMCAAPGGKTTHIAQRMENKGRIFAFDVYERKIHRIAENAKRLGIDIIEACLHDARTIGEQFSMQADRVLVDVPCTGMGVLRRKPDARWNKRREDLRSLPVLQREILESAAMTVKPGGIMVYSTCTMEPEENTVVVEEFLHMHPEFICEDAGAFLPGKKSSERMLQLMPSADGPDGFFIARMRRL